MALVGVVGLGGARAIGSVAGSIGSAFGGIVAAIIATPLPSATPIPILDPPVLNAPAQPYTRQDKVTITGSIASRFTGQSGYSIRIEDSVDGAAATVVKEVAAPPIASFTVVDLPLSQGTNDLTARLVGPAGSSDPSPVVTFILDTQAPPVTITSPKDGTTVNRATVTITGQTQPQSTLLARNEANGATASATAGADGSFQLSVALADGTNGITVTATDPAGNSGSAVVGVTRGSGALSGTLSISPYRFSAKTGAQLSMQILVTDPDGHALAGAQVQFTITIPGLQPIQPSEIVTDANGQASFSTVIPPGASTGPGLVVALVTTDQFGETSARQARTVSS